MNKFKGLKVRFFTIYITSLVLYVVILLVFSYQYTQHYLDDKLIEAYDMMEEKIDADEGMLMIDAVKKLNNLGYDVQTYDNSFDKLNNNRLGNELDEKFYQEFVKEDNYVEDVSIHETGNGIYLVITDTKDIGITHVSVNDELVEEYVSNLYLVIISTVIIYIVASMFIIQYFALKIINPLISISEELEKIALLELDGERLEYDYTYEIVSIIDNIENIKVSLRSYYKNRSSLVSAFVHEIKSPLATISSVMQLNEMGHENYDDKTTKEIIEKNILIISIITKTALEVFEKKKLYRMVKREAGQIIVDEVMKIKPNYDKKNLYVSMKMDNSIWNMDEESFRLIISNLLSNIYRYSKENTKVFISVSGDKILFVNDIADDFTSGTGQGIVIISNLLSDMNMNLHHFEDEGKYNVIISKQKK